MYLNHILVINRRKLDFLRTEKVAVIMRLQDILLLATTQCERYIISSERSIRDLWEKLSPKQFALLREDIIINRRYYKAVASYLKAL